MGERGVYQTRKPPKDLPCSTRSWRQGQIKVPACKNSRHRTLWSTPRGALTDTLPRRYEQVTPREMGTTDVGNNSIQGCTSQGRSHGAAYKGPQASQLPLFSQGSLPTTEKPHWGAKRKIFCFYFFKGPITEKKAIRISGLKKRTAFIYRVPLWPV